MSNDNINQITPEEEAVVDATEVAEEVAENVTDVSSDLVFETGFGATEAVPVAKTRKERKKERKEIKKQKKQVKKEARLHSAKTTKMYNLMVNALTIFVIFTMLFCTVNVFKISKNIDSAVAGVAGNAGAAGGAAGGAGGAAGGAGGAAGGVAGEDVSEDYGDPSDVNSKAGAVQLFKDAHAKVLAEAKSVTRVLDNNTNYKEYLEVGGNAALSGVAKTLMGMFLVANEEQLVYSGADLAAKFPPTNNSCDGLTPAMIGEHSVKEEGGNYIVTLSLKSSEENPDLGDNAAHLVNIVQSSDVEGAAAGFVGFEGLRNEYIAPTVTATIEKESGKMLDLHTVTPSYMKFDKAIVMKVVNVSNVGIGLQYETKWTVQW